MPNDFSASMQLLSHFPIHLFFLTLIISVGLNFGCFRLFETCSKRSNKSFGFGFGTALRPLEKVDSLIFSILHRFDLQGYWKTSNITLFKLYMILFLDHIAVC